jgi:invasion protein IalB
MTRVGFGQAALAAFCLAGLGSAPAVAQLAPPPTQTPAPAPAPGAAEAPQTPALVWTTRCTSEGRRLPLDCAMEQRAYITSTGQFIGSVTLRLPPDTQSPVMMITTPLGLSLAGGVVFNIDGGTPTTLPLQTCDNNGCYAGAPVSSEMLSAMSRGTTLNVTFKNLSQQDISLPMSLLGFTAAYQKIQ